VPFLNEVDWRPCLPPWNGASIGVCGQAGNVVRIQPPLVIEDAALDHALDVVEQALSRVMGS